MKKILSVLLATCLWVGIPSGILAAEEQNVLQNDGKWEISCSSEINIGNIKRAFDDDTSTYWHSGYTAEGGSITEKDDPPFIITVTFPEKQRITGWKYYPRTDRATGTILNYIFRASEDGVNFEDIEEKKTGYSQDILKNDFIYSSKWRAYTAKSVQIEITDSVSGYGTASEIVFLTDGREVSESERIYRYINRDGIKVSASSARTGSAKKLLDGDDDTYWHSDYKNQESTIISHDEPPYELAFTFPEVKYISGVSFLPRQDMKNGRVYAMDIYATDDENNEFVLIKGNNTFEDNKDEKIIDFGANYAVKMIKGVITDSAYGYGTIAEFNFYDKDEGYENIRYSRYSEISRGGIYPLKSSYKSGIANIDKRIFKESKVKYPIETGYENINEIKNIKSNSFDDQISVTEEKRSGKFALCVTPLGDEEILSIAESEYFEVGEGAASSASAGDLIDSNRKDDESEGQMQNVQLKANIIELYLKPMENADTIEFFTKKKTDDETEEYIKITSDKNGDGVYELGVDFSRGKWQKTVFDLGGISDDGEICGLYMKARKNSRWLFDDVSSYYSDKKATKADLAKAASGNIVLKNEGLSFAESKALSEYDATPQVVVSDTRVKGTLKNIKIDDSGIINENIAGEANSIHYAPFSSGEWTLNGAAECVNSIEQRAFLPEIPQMSKEMTVELNAEKEEKIRINYTASSYSTINFSSENKSPLTYNGRTDWFDEDVTVTTSRTAFKNNLFKITSIDYEEKDGDKDLTLAKNAGASVGYGETETSDRTKVTLTLSFPDSASKNGGKILVEYKDSSETRVFATYVTFEAKTDGETELSAIMPKIEKGYKLYIKNESSETVRVKNVKTYALAESDWNMSKKNASIPINEKVFYSEKESYTTAKLVNVSDIVTEENAYAVHNNKAMGLSYLSNRQQNAPANKICTFRFINLSNDPACVKVGSKEYYLGYGESDIQADSAGYYLPNSAKTVLIGITVYGSEENKNTNNVPLYSIEGMNEVFKYNSDGTRIYYANYYDGGKIYAYDFTTNKAGKILDESADEIYISPGETKILTYKDQKYKVTDLETKEEETVYEPSKSYSKAYMLFNGEDEIIYSAGKDIFTYENKKSTKINEVSADPNEIAVSRNGQYIAIYSGRSLYIVKKMNGIWNEVKNFRLKIGKNDSEYSGEGKPLAISDDGITVYIDGYTVNVSTEKMTQCVYDAYLASEGIFVTKDFIIYDTIKNEKKRMFSSTMKVGDGSIIDMHYNKSTGYVSFILSNGTVGRTLIDDSKYGVKYLFSFDGSATWYNYKNSRWNKVSDDRTPTLEQMKKSGMTSAEIEMITEDDYKKLYSDGLDIFSVSTAIYMYSNFTNATPIVSGIYYETADSDQIDGLYAVRGNIYKKDTYNSIESIYPVEQLESSVQCYYFLTLGDNWIYTVKNGEVIKMTEGADELFGNVHDNWMAVKQYGMNYSELSGVSGKTLTALLTNPEYANDEFGVVYVLKTDRDSTKNNSVDVKIRAEGKYFEAENSVLEITLYGGDVKRIKASETPDGEIDSFMSWLEGRQKGYGTEFYLIKTNAGQIFINYYMISSINVVTEEKESGGTEK